jgi:hypothetical protein
MTHFPIDLNKKWRVNLLKTIAGLGYLGFYLVNFIKA